MSAWAEKSYIYISLEEELKKLSTRLCSCMFIKLESLYWFNGYARMGGGGGETY